MDLISRKSVAEKMARRRDYVSRPSEPDCIIADEPSAPAVPLDKLCELLSKGAYPCTILSASLCPFEACNATNRYSNNVSKDCWRAVLSKWMEEQDAAD